MNIEFLLHYYDLTGFIVHTHGGKWRVLKCYDSYGRWYVDLIDLDNKRITEDYAAYNFYLSYKQVFLLKKSVI